ncbi:GSCOCG00011149001-RA-CDS [Cotesia congregata]|nr:GSCOCG00011149001-RA-CDS [Cotesia congregata]
MLIDICKNYLNTKVKCDKPSCDDYDIENLISENDRGFLVYSCINPPINIDFNFTNLIKLSHVIIWPAIGEQKSIGFKLSVNLRDNTINQLAVGFLEPSDSGIIFCCNDSDVNQLKTNYRNFSIKYISGFAHKFVNSTDNLKLTIMKTQKSVAAVKRIQIWGYVRPNSKIHQLFTEYNDKINCCKNVSLPVEIKDAEIKPQSSDKKSLEIPDEFLDPITCSLMIQPIILPSGKIIDHSTLETYGKNEALWGRQLSDPFTGLRLSNNFRPVYAQALKCRIDKFITDNHCHADFNNIPRVLGPHRHSTVDVDLNSISAGQKGSLSASKINFLTGSIPRNIKTSHRIPIIASYSRFSCLKPKLSKKIKKVTEINCFSSSEAATTENNILNESTIIDENLRDSLKALLSNLKTLSQAEVKKEPDNEIVCKCCKNSEIKDICGYKLTCSHVVCRSALLASVDNNNNSFCCDKCNINCRTNEIIKIHLRRWKIRRVQNIPEDSSSHKSDICKNTGPPNSFFPRLNF